MEVLCAVESMGIKNTFRKIVVVISVMALVAIGFFGVGTFAWFYTQKTSSENTITMGKLEITVNDLKNETFELPLLATDNVMPGQPLLKNNITVNKTAESVNCYLRVEAKFEKSSDVTADIDSFVTALNASLTTYFSSYKTSTYKFTNVSGTNYYYLTDTAGKPLALGDNTPSDGVVLMDKDNTNLKVSTSLVQMSGYAQYGQKINVVINVQAIQSEWLEIDATNLSELHTFMNGQFAKN